MEFITKTPIGTLDLYGDLYDLTKLHLNWLEDIFKSYGGIGLETPIYEISSNLKSKYGEEADNKLIFDIEKKAMSDTSEAYSLRYDLTVPKLRFLASNTDIQKARIYSIGKVYRRDTPSPGRLREFYQADFDIYGDEPLKLVSELTIFHMIHKYLKWLGLESKYKIHLNWTSNLYQIIKNVLSDEEFDNKKFKLICACIDKLDKKTFEELINEFKGLGLSTDQIEKLKDLLNQTAPLCSSALEAFEFIKSNGYDLTDHIVFDPTLARGLDYYSGPIFEVKINQWPTIISGGRYTNYELNCIGVSFGVSRIIDLLSRSKSLINLSEIVWKDEYWLTQIELDIVDIKTKLFIHNKLENILSKPINMFDTDKKIKKTVTWCDKNKVRYLLIIAPNEFAQGNIILKDIKNSTQTYLKIC